MSERSMSAVIKSNYDERSDILYLTLLNNNENTYGDEISENVYLLRDIDSDIIVGVMIFHPYIHTAIKQKSLNRAGLNIQLSMP